MGKNDASWELDGVRWDRIKVLGKGSFGEAILVKRAGASSSSSSSLPETAVCKRVVLSSMKPAERKEAVNEVNVLKRLRHPNIVEYLGSFEKDDTLHIFMEYANAGDVEALVKAQKASGQLFDEQLIASLVLQMASAIKYLHSRRILHRDLKSQNVFLARRRPGGPLVVKLGDFGISTVLRNTHALAKTVCGTPYYFSPELCLNKPYNSKTDIWSLGCIIYEMATTRHAFDAQNMKALVARILKGNYNPVSSRFSADLGKLIDQMLQQKADRRLDIDGVLSSSWARRHAAALCQNDLMRTITANIKVPGVGPDAAVSSAAAPAAPAPERRPSAPPHRTPAGSGAVAAAAAERPRVVDSRPVVPAPVAQRPSENSRDKSGMKRQALAAERRDALEKLDRERRRAIEEKRKAKNAAAERRYAAAPRRQEQLDDLDEIRKRMELQSYEEQQQYVERGWDELERVGNVQDKREEQARQREQHLDMLKQQMADIETKMNARRAERGGGGGGGQQPHTGGRAGNDAPAPVPAGFTPASWAIHQQQMQRPSDDRHNDYGVMRPMAPPRAGAGGNDEFDIDAILASQRGSSGDAARPVARDDPDALLWQEEKRRIEAARAKEPKKPTAAELAWQQQQAKIRAAREAEAAATAEHQARFRQQQEERMQQQKREEAEYRSWVVGADANAPDQEFDNVVAFINQVQRMPENSSGGDGGTFGDEGVGPAGDEQFDEPALPANDVSRLTNTVKFTLDGKTLHLRGASKNDPLTHRVEALRVFLTDALGGDSAFEDLHQSLEYIQNCDADDDEADNMLVELEAAYGPKAKYVDLMVQYMVCVSMLG